MALPVDMELKKAFTELQGKMVDTKQKLRFSDHQIETLKSSIRHAQLTDQEIERLPVGTNVYTGIGRMFLLTDIESAHAGLQTKISFSNDKIKNLESNKEYLERNLKESENNLRELITHKQAA